MMPGGIDTGNITVGVVGLGLMGSSIVVSLLLAGHKVIAVAPIPNEKEKASRNIKSLLIKVAESGLSEAPAEEYLASLFISDDYQELDDCRLVLECVVEDIGVKKAVYKKITNAVGADTIIATNTSGIPISSLQEYVIHPERFIGAHWAEPAFATRFMEIICGKYTSARAAGWIYELAHSWGKEPTLLTRDIKGFITNRLMYAVTREALSLVESGYTTLADVDKSLRYDAGSWMTLMGIFRRLDYLGLKDFLVIFRTVFPDLSNGREVPVMMQRLANTHGRGIYDGHGLFHYTKEEAGEWEAAFAAFNRDIYYLAAQYPSEQAQDILKEPPQN